ncbi:hypothetical protein AC480_01125 [miscellaneous Crenarchaeota group archaeon SMTZ1-55]|nr:MAG: hypothetical protein AC480_01125 [miscellaneous Crenarchaeota group archaeon SMTZ1-55]
MDPGNLIFVLLLVAVLIVVYQYRHVFPLLRYRMIVKSWDKPVEAPPEPTIETVCPRCGDAMENGYVAGPRGIYWSRSIHPYSLDMPFPGPEMMGEPLAPYHVRLPGRSLILRASRCRKCGIIQVDLRRQDFNMI